MQRLGEGSLRVCVHGESVRIWKAGKLGNRTTPILEVEMRSFSNDAML